MKPSDVVATHDPAAGSLTLSCHGRPAFTIGLNDYCDQTLDPKADRFTLRLITMTRFEFEGWQRNATDASFAAVRAFADQCHQALLAR